MISQLWPEHVAGLKNKRCKILNGLSPFVGCIPFFSVTPRYIVFIHQIADADRTCILQSYTYRIRSISIEDCNIDPDDKSLKFLSNPPPTVSNLRILHCEYKEGTMPLLHLPLSSLLLLDVEFENLHLFQNFLNSFPVFSPTRSKRRLCIGMREVVLPRPTISATGKN